MKKGGIGGSNTQSGIEFEAKADFSTLIAQMPGYKVEKLHAKIGNGIYHNGVLVARCFKKHDFYKFREEIEIDWKNITSTKLLPDDALLIIVRETIFIIEVKFQSVHGSVDEKLQTCDFKLKKYKRLLQSSGYLVEYVYVLNDWFKQPRYKETLDYILSVHCHYMFNELPLSWLGLPN
jgi:hypothetical protein